MSLIELIFSIVIVGVGLAALVGLFTAVTRNSVDPLIRKQELAIAESMMEEIQLKPFNNPTGGFTGTATVANRALFDNVADYNGYNVLGVYAADGTPIPALSTYRTVVVVAGVALGTGATAVPATTGALRITVTVTGPGAEALALVGYRTNYF